MANSQFNQFYFTRHRYPVQLDCNFAIDQTNANGTGIRSLKGPGIANVFMNTSPVSVPTTSVFASGVQVVTVANSANLYVGQAVTDGTTAGNITSGTTVLAINYSLNQVTLSKVTAGASASSPGDTLNFVFTIAAPGNPNPPAGFALIKFSDNFRRYYFGTSGFVTQLSGTPITVTAAGAHLTAGVIYVIAVVGTTTAADWVALGVPIGTTPAVGVTFEAIATGAGIGTGIVEVPAISGSGIQVIDVIGDPNTTIVSTSPKVLGGGSGAYMWIRFLAPTSSSVTTLIATAPANNSVCGLSFLFSNSSQGYGSAGGQ